MIPGIPAAHCIIRPECRAGRGDIGAFEEAVRRCRDEYQAVLDGYRKRGHEPPEMRLALMVVSYVTSLRWKSPYYFWLDYYAAMNELRRFGRD